MEPHDIAAAWLHGFALAAFRGDVAATVDTILPDGFLRDWLVFTWDIRSLEGHASISAYLVPTLVSTHLYNFKLDDRAGAAPETVLDVGVGAGFTFEMLHRRRRGYVRLFPSTCDITKEWKAMSLFLMVEDIKGHEELGPELGVYGGHTLSWAEVLAERRALLNLVASRRWPKRPEHCRTLQAVEHSDAGCGEESPCRRQLASALSDTVSAHHQTILSMLVHSSRVRVS